MAAKQNGSNNTDEAVRIDHREPLKPSGKLAGYESVDVTPVIGTEFKSAKLLDWLEAPDSDELLRELAITGVYKHVSVRSSADHRFLIRHNFQVELKQVTNYYLTVSRRGVVIFRAQDGITTEHQKELARRLGRLSGGPETSDLHIHPVNNSRQNPGVDDYVSMVGDKQVKNYGGIGGALSNNADGKRQSSRQEWHTDIQWERVPCDYSVLRMEVIPPTGGGRSCSLAILKC